MSKALDFISNTKKLFSLMIQLPMLAALGVIMIPFIPFGVMAKVIENTTVAMTTYALRAIYKIALPFRTKASYRHPLFSNYYLKTQENQNLKSYNVSTINFWGRLISSPIWIFPNIVAYHLIQASASFFGAIIDDYLNYKNNLNSKNRKRYRLQYADTIQKYVDKFILNPMEAIVDGSLDIGVNLITLPFRSLSTWIFDRQNPMTTVLIECQQEGYIKQNGEYFSHSPISATIASEVSRLSTLIKELDHRYKKNLTSKRVGNVITYIQDLSCCHVPTESEFSFLDIERNTYQDNTIEHNHVLSLEKTPLYKFIKYRERALELQPEATVEENRTPIKIFDVFST